MTSRASSITSALAHRQGFHDPLRATQALPRISAGNYPASSHTRSSADGWGRLCSRHGGRDEDVLHRLADLHQRCRTRLRMCFQRPVLGPAAGLVMVIDVAQSQAGIGLVHDHTHVAADTHGPNVWTSRLVELVQWHAGLRRVQLPVEGGGVDRLLLLAGQPPEALGARVGDAACPGVYAPDPALYKKSIPDFWLVLRRRLCHTASHQGYSCALSSCPGSSHPSTCRASHDTDG
jgi:hypothetical protein